MEFKVRYGHKFGKQRAISASSYWVKDGWRMKMWDKDSPFKLLATREIAPQIKEALYEVVNAGIIEILENTTTFGKPVSKKSAKILIQPSEPIRVYGEIAEFEGHGKILTNEGFKVETKVIEQKTKRIILK